MSFLALVITLLLLKLVEGDAAAAVPWKEEGEVPAWSDGGGGTETVDDNIVGRAQQNRCGGMKEHAKKSPAQKFKIHKI